MTKNITIKDPIKLVQLMKFPAFVEDTCHPSCHWLGFPDILIPITHSCILFNQVLKVDYKECKRCQNCIELFKEA